MKINDLLYSVVAVLSVVIFMANAQADDLSKSISVSNAWVQAMPPSQTVTSAYMTILNNSPKEAVIESASSDIAGTTELCQMDDVNDVMRMDTISAIHVPAQGKVTLKPGGYHIMFVDLKKPVHKGEMVSFTLHFQDGSALAVAAQVKMQQEDGPSGMAGMKM